MARKLEELVQLASSSEGYRYSAHKLPTSAYGIYGKPESFFGVYP